MRWRRLPSEHAATAVFMRVLALLRDHVLHGRAPAVAFESPRLVVEALERAELFFLSELCVADGGLENPDGLIIDAKRHRKRMPVLAAVSKGEPGRIAEPAWGTMQAIAASRSVAGERYDWRSRRNF